MKRSGEKDCNSSISEIGMQREMCKYFEVCAGSAIDARTGKYIQEQPFHMASRALYYAKKGDRLVVKRSGVWS